MRSLALGVPPHLGFLPAPAPETGLPPARELTPGRVGKRGAEDKAPAFSHMLPYKPAHKTDLQQEVPRGPSGAALRTTTTQEDRESRARPALAAVQKHGAKETGRAWHSPFSSLPQGMVSILRPSQAPGAATETNASQPITADTL